jgi:orotidine-5'-phosphate decarboxylase
MGAIDPDLKRFKTIFADKKISHGADTGSRILKRLAEDLGPRYVTVSANLGHSILRKYVEEARKYGMDIIAWTVHTKTSPEDAQKMYKRPLNDVILNLAEMAWGAGCHAVVLEAGMLEDERIRELPIKKLVTGIRIDPSDKGSQKRVSSLEEVAKMKEAINYAVISSRYLEDIEATTQIVEALKPREV